MKHYFKKSSLLFMISSVGNTVNIKKHRLNLFAKTVCSTTAENTKILFPIFG